MVGGVRWCGQAFGTLRLGDAFVADFEIQGDQRIGRDDKGYM